MTWLETDVSASCETHCDTLGYGEGEAVPVRPPCHFASAFSLQRSCKHSRDKVTSNTLPSQSPHLKDRCLGPAAICKRPEEERSRPPPPHPPRPWQSKVVLRKLGRKWIGDLLIDAWPQSTRFFTAEGRPWSVRLSCSDVLRLAVCKNRGEDLGRRSERERPA